MAVSALDQQVMNDAGQRVVTIVTDQQGHLQTRLTQPLYVTMQNGRQGIKKRGGGRGVLKYTMPTNRKTNISNKKNFALFNIQYTLIHIHYALIIIPYYLYPLILGTVCVFQCWLFPRVSSHRSQRMKKLNLPYAEGKLKLYLLITWTPMRR